MTGTAELFVLAIALALDATVVAAGLASGRTPPRLLVEAAILFGLFQAGMAGLGAVGGTALTAWTGSLTPWVAAVLLGAVGGRMLVGAGEEEVSPAAGRLQLISLAVATSLDALAAGVGLHLVDVPLGLSLAVIGVVTGALGGLGALLGQRLAETHARRAEQLGGLVLIGIGLRILASHLLG